MECVKRSLYMVYLVRNNESYKVLSEGRPEYITDDEIPSIVILFWFVVVNEADPSRSEVWKAHSGELGGAEISGTRKLFYKLNSIINI